MKDKARDKLKKQIDELIEEYAALQKAYRKTGEWDLGRLEELTERKRRLKARMEQAK
jgi:hypothetical protein